MKRIISLLITIVLCSSLAGCSLIKENEKAVDTDKVTSDEVTTTVEVDPFEDAKVKLSQAYTVCCDDDADYADLAYDELSLVIDTNPDDVSYYELEEEAISAIVLVNSYLGLPSSIIDKMSSTRALDGMQSQDCGDFIVTWTYHPDNGLRVIYEVSLS